MRMLIGIKDYDSDHNLQKEEEMIIILNLLINLLVYI